ncbi:hypothetical protein [Ideonella dechloratans]
MDWGAEDAIATAGAGLSGVADGRACDSLLARRAALLDEAWTAVA